MPNKLIPIAATYESVTRLAAKSVISHVMKMTGLAADTVINFSGNEIGNNFQPGSSISGGAENVFEHYDKVSMTVLEEYKDDAIINSPVRHQDSPYVFKDEALGIILKPIYSYTSVTLNVEFRADSRVKVESWLHGIKIRIADNRSALLHELDYHYEVPDVCLNVLAHLHELREAVAGYGEDLSTYFREHFTKRTTSLTTMGGKGNLIVVGEKAVGIQGWFEFTEPGQPEKDSGGASWTSSFSYHYNYQKPVSLNFIYPQFVHGQQIDNRLFSKERPYSLRDRATLGTETVNSYEAVQHLYRLPPDPMGGKRYPFWDEWVPTGIPGYTASLSSWLIDIDIADPSLVLNMDHLGPDVMHAVFRSFLVKEQPYVCKRGDSLIYFTLFRGLDPMEDGCIYMDDKLNIRTRKPMNVRESYHLRIAVVTELSLLTKRALDAIRDNGYAALLIWQSLFPSLDVEYAISKMPDKSGDGFLSGKYIDWFFQYLRDQSIGGLPSTGNGSYNDTHNPLYNNYYIEWPLVNILTIIASKRKE